MEPRRPQHLFRIVILPLVLSAVLAVLIFCSREGPAATREVRSPVRQEDLERYLEARRLYGEERFREALEILLENQRSDPTFSENSYLIGKIHFFSGDHVEARETWESTLESNPHHLDTCKWLARLHLLEGRAPAAERLVVTALADSAEDPELLILLGKSRRAQNDLPGAIECYRKAQVLSERLVEASLELAELYQAFGMPGRAAEELERAASLLPEKSGLSQAVEAAAAHLQGE